MHLILTGFEYSASGQIMQDLKEQVSKGITKDQTLGSCNCQSLFKLVPDLNFKLLSVVSKSQLKGPFFLVLYNYHPKLSDCDFAILWMYHCYTLRQNPIADILRRSLRFENKAMHYRWGNAIGRRQLWH